MLYIVPFRQSSDIYQYDWWKSDELIKIIVPHPKLADSIREMGERYRPDLSIESTTIADFIKNEILYRDPEIKLYKKYQLILELSTLWKKYFPSSTYDEFLGVFDSFTQLRGITMNFDLVEEVLDNSYLGLADRDIESIKKFWKYLEIREIYDEHAACYRLAEQYEDSIRKEAAKKMVLYGFSHLSSGQCDLINVMGGAHDIYIPIHANVWSEVRESDWIKWIDAKVLPASPEKKKSSQVSLVKIHNNGLAQAIKQWAEKYCKNDQVEIVLAQKNPDFFQMGELAWGDVYFKAEVSIFGNTYTKIFNDLDEGFNWREDVGTESVLNFLQNVVKNELDKNFDEKDFKVVKVASFIQDEIKKWMNLSEENTFMKIFDYHVFKNSLELNLPRNHIFPKADQGMRAKVKGLEEIGTVGSDRSVIICATSGYSDLDSQEDHWTEKMMEYFLKIGPVKRREFEFNMFRESIRDILSEHSSFLIIEEVLMEESYLWSEILSGFEPKNIGLENCEGKGAVDYIKGREKKAYNLSEKDRWSSGKIQKYLDCPRAFYYSYVDQVHFSPENQQEVEARELGSLQHKIIRLYLEQFDTLKEEAHYNLVQAIWEQFLRDKNLILNDINYRNGFVEIKNYSWRGVKALLDIKGSYPKVRFSFEIEFFSQTHRGSIDCIINLGNGMMGIIDFKRSHASVPSKSDIFDFKKIQLWYYMHNFKQEGFDSCFLGYLCLDELEKSQFVFDEGIFSGFDFRTVFPDGKIYGCSFQEKGRLFEEFIKEKMENILEDKEFLPIPQSNKVCKFCWIDKVCVRDEAMNADE